MENVEALGGAAAADKLHIYSDALSRYALVHRGFLPFAADHSNDTVLHLH